MASASDRKLHGNTEWSGGSSGSGSCLRGTGTDCSGGSSGSGKVHNGLASPQTVAADSSDTLAHNLGWLADTASRGAGFSRAKPPGNRGEKSWDGQSGSSWYSSADARAQTNYSHSEDVLHHHNPYLESSSNDPESEVSKSSEKIGLRKVLAAPAMTVSLKEWDQDHDVDNNWSEGTKLHPFGLCKPCLFVHCRSGCSSSRQCQFCHAEHAASVISSLRGRPLKEDLSAISEAPSQQAIEAAFRLSTRHAPKAREILQRSMKDRIVTSKRIGEAEDLLECQEEDHQTQP
mmetsp:Transcript_67237/g.180667  ORF Transcript_67237/g.180667 Transcript_67237/m.180667 type:complete len:289 (-) Transcript_67237:76-942(-)